jgi:predicted transcriptional regulator
MSDQTLPVKFADVVELAIPQFDDRPEITLEFTSIKEGERRLIEAKLVNPSTYSELEYTFNESYREAKKNLSIIGYEITQAERIFRRIKSELMLDTYPEFLKEKKLKDNATIRDAFLEQNKDYVDAQERINMLKAMESLIDGKIKVFENVCRYMRKEMDILIRSGSMNSNKY